MTGGGVLKIWSLRRSFFGAAIRATVGATGLCPSNHKSRPKVLLLICTFHHKIRKFAQHTAAVVMIFELFYRLFCRCLTNFFFLRLRLKYVSIENAPTSVRAPF